MISYARTSFVNSILVYNRSLLVVIRTNWNPVVKSLWNVPSLSCFLWQRKIGCSQWMHNPSYEIFQLVAQSSSWSTHSYWTCRQRERLDTDTNWYGQHFWIKFRLCPIHSAAHVGTPSDTLADVSSILWSASILRSGIKALLHSNRKEHSNTKKDHGWMY